MNVSVLKDFSGRTLFDNLAVLHDTNAVRNLTYNARSCKSTKETLPSFTDLSAKKEKMRLNGYVERRRRLVRN